ncbi:hypothetical protein LO772_10030 [Yinghuangia sp. ASG 101]|uniref:hypothetical protein n=1 Tax=Yinghuangia sp. ASG 101 TaxID=2896848 RepID=UPI001E40EB81|nr:hypothetical protein [Yinghuangia sp. ASG 101]UGQ13897.1 hypothetical protein LO772_10030 [Yinghuangia sp. ASG 101]
MRAAYLRAVTAVGALVALYVAIALPFVVVALCVAGLLAGAELFTSGEAVLVAEVVIALVALLLELVGPRRLPAGVSVGPRDQPHLWELVRATARDLHVPEPDGIVLTGGASVGLRAVRRPGISLHRHLVLGCAVPDNLSERKLRAVIAVALGDLRRRRPPLPDRIALHGVDAAYGLADALRGRGALGDAAERFADRYAELCAPVAELQARVRDRFAAGVYGTDTIAEGLDALRRLRTAWGWYRRDYVDAGLVCGCLPADPLGDLRALVAEPGRAAALAAPPSDTDPLAVRAGRLRARPLPAKVPLRDDAAATAAPGLADPRRVTSHLHAYLVLADAEGFTPDAFEALDALAVLDRDAYLRQVNGYRAAYRAARLAPAARRAGADMPVTLGGVLALLLEGRGARLAREYDARAGAADSDAGSAADEPADTGSGTSAPGAADDLPGTGATPPSAAALAALLACAWVDAGSARWKPTWSGRDEVTALDGTPVDLAGPADRALAGPDGAHALRAALADDGVSLYYEARVPKLAATKERETAAGHR